jgi:anti-anti-sigma regulatory factor
LFLLIYFPSIQVVFDVAMGKHHSNKDVSIVYLIIDASAWTEIDLSGMNTLFDIHSDLLKVGVQLSLACAKGRLRDYLEKARFTAVLGKENIFPSIHDAVCALPVRRDTIDLDLMNYQRVKRDDSRLEVRSFADGTRLMDTENALILNARSRDISPRPGYYSRSSSPVLHNTMQQTRGIRSRSQSFEREILATGGRTFFADHHGGVIGAAGGAIGVGGLNSRHASVGLDLDSPMLSPSTSSGQSSNIAAIGGTGISAGTLGLRHKQPLVRRQSLPSPSLSDTLSPKSDESDQRTRLLRQPNATASSTTSTTPHSSHPATESSPRHLVTFQHQQHQQRKHQHQHQLSATATSAAQQAGRGGGGGGVREATVDDFSNSATHLVQLAVPRLAIPELTTTRPPSSSSVSSSRRINGDVDDLLDELIHNPMISGEEMKYSPQAHP